MSYVLVVQYTNSRADEITVTVYVGGYKPMSSPVSNSLSLWYASL